MSKGLTDAQRREVSALFDSAKALQIGTRVYIAPLTAAQVSSLRARLNAANWDCKFDTDREQYDVKLYRDAPRGSGALYMVKQVHDEREYDDD